MNPTSTNTIRETWNECRTIRLDETVPGVELGLGDAKSLENRLAGISVL